MSGLALSTPSATPPLVKERRRPLTKTTYWLGPTVPIESGGKAPVSVSVAPSKERAVVCVRGSRAEASSTSCSLPAGKRERAGASGFCGNPLRLG